MPLLKLRTSIYGYSTCAKKTWCFLSV